MLMCAACFPQVLVQKRVFLQELHKMEQEVLQQQRDSAVPVEHVEKDDYRLSKAYYEQVRYCTGSCAADVRMDWSFHCGKGWRA
jgi:hypothetical protein